MTSNLYSFWLYFRSVSWHHTMNIKKTNVFIYPLDSKVIFPYHEYAFSLSSHVYERIDHYHIKQRHSIISSALPLASIKLNNLLKGVSNQLMGFLGMGWCLKSINQKFLDIVSRIKQRSLSTISLGWRSPDSELALWTKWMEIWLRALKYSQMMSWSNPKPRLKRKIWWWFWRKRWKYTMNAKWSIMKPRSKNKSSTNRRVSIR